MADTYFFLVHMYICIYSTITVCDPQVAVRKENTKAHDVQAPISSRTLRILDKGGSLLEHSHL